LLRRKRRSRRVYWSIFTPAFITLEGPYDIAAVQMLLVAVARADLQIRLHGAGAVLLPHEDGFPMSLAAVDSGHEPRQEETLRRFTGAIPTRCAVGGVDWDLVVDSRHCGCSNGRERD